uniref:DUF2875 domain-containing protein n=1 Tax=Echinostoma caproni TaxID=27848 RepID=A0A183AIA4_9TREM
LTLRDWDDVAEPLASYVENYDLKIVCAEIEIPSEYCQSNGGPLASKYFLAALNQTQVGPASRVWRIPTSGLLYGALIILDPENTKVDPVDQAFSGAFKIAIARGENKTNKKSSDEALLLQAL